MDEARARRLALNESLFRDVNELIKEQQAENKDDRPTFVCECVKVSCQLRLPVPLDEYHGGPQTPRDDSSFSRVTRTSRSRRSWKTAARAT